MWKKNVTFSQKAAKIKESAKKYLENRKNVEGDSKEENDIDPYFWNIIATTLVYLERTKGIKFRTQFMRVVWFRPIWLKNNSSDTRAFLNIF